MMAVHLCLVHADLRQGPVLGLELLHSTFCSGRYSLDVCKINGLVRRRQIAHLRLCFRWSVLHAAACKNIKRTLLEQLQLCK